MYPLIKRNPLSSAVNLLFLKKSWDTIKDVGANARNVVAGLLHSKEPNVKIAEKLDFVAYELVEPKMDLSS